MYDLSSNTNRNFIFQFSYTDDQSEEYSINFAAMTTTCISKQTQRQIIRHADFNLPDHWEVQSNNIAKFKVKSDSSEYQEIHALFDKTMAKKYAGIVCIYRIQNKQWYMQYSSYKSFSPKKDTEKKLFHGCPKNVAELIIHSFFNRSFAGVNGLIYFLNNFFVKPELYF